MSVRTDNANLIITIDAKESVEYQKAVQRSAELTRNIKKMTVGSAEYIAALKEQAEISKRLGETDYTKLSLKNLADRKKALQDQIRILPQAQAAELGLERELQRVNTALSENARRVRATNNEMQNAAPAATGFGASFKKGLAFLAPLGIVEGIRQIGGALFGLAKDSVTAFDGAAKAEAQLEAAIKSTGGAAGKSVDQLIEQSSELQKITLYSDDQIQEAQGLLLTFTKVQGEIYDQAIPAITDMAAAMKTDLSTASIQVGKALNDPIKGVGALSKAGVQFTAEQKATIKTLVETGDVAGAQTIILKELETQFNGSAKAAADAGLGPLQKFQNRIGDIQEGIGLLITNGLGFLGPILDKVATFAEKFVGVLVSGKKATGEMSGAVNFLVGLLKIVYNTISFVVSAIVTWYDRQLQIFELLKGLPGIGIIVRAFANTFNFIIDAVTNTSAVFAGLKAAIQQTFDNASNYIKKTLTDIKIFAKEADLLLSFKSSTKERIKGEIQALEAESAQYAKAGKTVGQAYTDAYNDVITKELKAQSIVSKVDDPLRTNTGGGTGNGGGGKGAKSKTEKEKEFSEIPKSFTISTTAQLELENRLKAIDEAAKREQLILSENYAKGLLTEDQYNVDKLRITSSKLAERISLLDQYGNTETDQRKELNIELLNNDKQLLEARAKLVIENEIEELSELEKQFLNRLISEQEYQLRSLRVKIDGGNDALKILQEQGLQETDEYKKLFEELLKLKVEYAAKEKAFDLQNKIDNVKNFDDSLALYREAMKAHQEGMLNDEELFQAKLKYVREGGQEFLKQTFDIAQGLYELDLVNRKKNASAIKAFEKARVLTDSLSEIGGIFKSTAGWGPIGWAVAIARSIAVGVRAAGSIAKIGAQQFYGSGQVLPYTLTGSQRIGVSPNIPTQAGGDNVLAMVKPGEVILNEDHQNKAGGPSFFASLGVPGFEGGGIVRLPNTVPTGLTSTTLGRAATDQAAVQADPRIDMLVNALTGMTQMMPAALSNIKANVNYFDIENKSSEINEIRDLARY